MIVMASAAACLHRPSAKGSFAVDQRRQWVDVTFDHIGPRVPQFPGERNIGVWFTFWNNSPYDIRLNEEPAAQSEGWIVPFWLAPRHRGPDGCVSTPESMSYSTELRRVKALLAPYEAVGIDIGGPFLPPGGKLLFSVPIDAMLPGVVLEAELGVRYPPARATSQVVTSVRFGWSSLPTSARALVVRAGGWAGGSQRACDDDTP